MLGDALLTSGAITAPQLDAALDRQRVTGSLLGETLVALDFITPRTLSRALAKQAGVPFARLTEAHLDRGVAALVPESFARKRLLVPLELKGSVLHVAQANPLDVLALDDLRQFTARPVSAICAPPDDVQAWIDRCYGADRDDANATDHHEAAVDLAFDASVPAVLPLSGIGLSRRDLAIVNALLNRPGGLVLVAGPDGVGKTTLDSMLAHLSGGSKRIVTIEDSVRSHIPGVHRTSIDPATGFTYAAALRSTVRQYPDVVMVDDICDPQAAQIALHAAQSGILVLSAWPAMDATDAVVRLVEMRLEPYLLASALTGIIAQRIVRLVCPDCKEPAFYSDDVLESVGLVPDPDVLFYGGRGCANCRGSGYHGSTSAFEVLVVDGAIQALIRAQADRRSIAEAATGARTSTLLDDALAKAVLQQTTLDEVVRLIRA